MPKTKQELEADERRIKAHEILYDDGLIDEASRVYANASKFIFTLDEKFQRWGDETYISQAQLDWLEKLRDEFL